MKWHNPLPLDLIVTHYSDSFKTFSENETGVPTGQHPGAFGVLRKHHVHEGVDLYAPEGTVVRAVQDGTVVAVLPFTGAHAGLPWWEDTWVVMVEGESGVVCYGEILPCNLLPGAEIKAGDPVGAIKRVLKTDKGRPMSMLHLELHKHGSRQCPEWHLDQRERPAHLLDPTLYLVAIAR